MFEMPKFSFDNTKIASWHFIKDLEMFILFNVYLLNDDKACWCSLEKRTNLLKACEVINHNILIWMLQNKDLTGKCYQKSKFHIYNGINWKKKVVLEKKEAFIMYPVLPDLWLHVWESFNSLGLYFPRFKLIVQKLLCCLQHDPIWLIRLLNIRKWCYQVI